MTHLEPCVKWREKGKIKKIKIKKKRKKRKKERKKKELMKVKQKGGRGPFLDKTNSEREGGEERFRERNSTFSLRSTKIGSSDFVGARGKVHLRIGTRIWGFFPNSKR